MIPDILPVESKIIPLDGFYQFAHVIAVNNNDIYIKSGIRTIVKTSDWLETEATLFYQSPELFAIRGMKILKDNSVIVVIEDYVGSLGGKVLKSTDNGATWNEVLTLPMIFEEWTGFAAYENIVLISDYDADNTNENNVWISKDYGSTFTSLIKLANISHPHAVAYDPYEHLIWIVTGDGMARDNIFVTDDFGATWNTLPDNVYKRCTNIMPLPNHVLFGTDELYHIGVYRHSRPDLGTFQTPINPEYFWFARKNTMQNSAEIWASIPAVTYGKEGRAYWGYVQPYNKTIVPSIVYVSDGNKVFPLWSENRLPQTIAGDNSFNGIVGVYGPTASGYLAVDFRSKYSDTTKRNLLRIKV